MSERHITRAARRLNVTQPAITIALNRLRALLDDEIVFRTSQGMVPTQLAISYLEPVRSILRDIDYIFSSESVFIPDSSRRVFRVRMSGLLAAIFLPGMSRIFRSEAPNCTLEVIRLEPAAITKSLEEGEIDFALGVSIEYMSSIVSESILPDRFVALRGRHACGAQFSPDMEEFCRLPQLRIAHGRFDTGFSDAILARFPVTFHNAVDATHWLGAGPILEETDLVLITSHRFAQITCRHYDVIPFDIPIDTPEVDWRYYVHRRNASDGGMLWLKSVVQRVAGEFETKLSEGIT